MQSCFSPKFSESQIQSARFYAAQSSLKLAVALESGKLPCNGGMDAALAWAAKCRNSADEIIAGQSDQNLSVWQRMNTFLTGECVALLPR